MAKTGIDTKDTVAQLGILIAEFIKLQKSSKDTAKSFVQLQSHLDSVGGVAGKSVAGFSLLEKQLKNTKTSQKSYVTQTKNLKTQIGLLTAQNQKLEAQMKKTSLTANKKKKVLTEMEKIVKMLVAAKKRLAVVESKEYSDLIKTRKAITDKNTAIRKEVAATNKSTNATKKNTQANKKSTKGFRGMIGGLRGLITAFGLVAGIQLFTQIVKDTFGLIKTFDGLNFAMKTITDTSFELETSQRFLLKITQDYGVALVSTSKRYLKFLAASKQVGLSLNDTEKIFESVTKAASVLGLKTDELTGVYLALEQMLSKGKVTTEELRRQLGERLPGAMGIMAAALDVTIPKLDSMLKKGEVLSADALPKFAEALEAAYGIESVKKVDTLVAAQNRLTNVWQLFVKDIGRDEGVVSRFFTSFLTNLEKTIKALGSLFMSRDFDFQEKVINESRVVTKVLEMEAEVRLNQNEIFLKKYNQQIQQARENLLKIKPGTEAYDIEEDNIRKLTKLNIDQNKVIAGVKKEIADEGFDAVRDEYFLEKKSYDEKINRYNELK
jgi:tape measure domain-containing protein